MKMVILFTVLLNGTLSLAAGHYPDLSKVEVYKAFTSKDSRSFIKRKVASDTSLREENLSSDMKKFRDEFKHVKNVEQLDQFFNKVSQELPKYSNDMKIVGSTFLMLKPFRGIDYRVRPLIDSPMGIQRKLQLLLGNSLKAMQLFLPTTEWKVINDYLIIPSKKNSSTFSKIGDLQNFLVSEVYPNLNTTVRTYKEVYDKTNNEDFYVFDNQISYGSASFQDGLQRYRAFGRPELAFMMASLYGTLHELSFFVAYNCDDALLALDTLRYGRFLTGLAHFNFLDVAKDHVTTIRKHKKLLTMREPQFSKAMMVRSHQYLIQSAYALSYAWRDLDLRTTDQHFMINGDGLRAYRQKNDLGLESFISLVESTDFHPVKSQVTGEVAWVNLYEFFHNPPQDLKVFLPVKFKSGPSKMKSSEGLTYQDYSIGRPVDWNYPAMSPYFKTTPTSFDSMDRLRRVMSGAHGGSLLVKLHLMVF